MAAPIGNKFAEGNEGGRPPIHTDPEEVGRLVQDYFQWIEGEFEDKIIEVEDEEGKKVKETRRIWIRKPEPPTITGLTLHLGFAHKSSLYDYAEKKEFSDYIKRGISRIEKYHEIQTAYGDKCTGNIFILKNFGWKDSQSIDHTTKGDKVQVTTIAFKSYEKD